ncbi:magnesium/cobalt transporter CorA [Streptoalloteichus hindustanus]|uniref:Magnesium transport protein CorA n=1 Tax=Streptoalloteichus hindustanus TaxID=2017 RepID=A0A1M5J5T5_STRHI|nr:magnesium/cobalt transporter CorA [Streptoalloteichus hindustanus]SHG35871.1 magnesium transporter [Streptoalloteichus hindustanus]
MPSLSNLGLRGRTTRNGRPIPPIRVPLSAYVVDCGVYLDGRRLPGRFTHAEAVRTVRERGEGFVWIGLHEPDEEQIKGIAETFGLHELAVEDAVHAHQRPKLERYDDVLFMVLKTVSYAGHEDPTTASELVETGEIMVFVGKDFLVTVRHGRHSGLRRLRQQLEEDPEQLALGPAAVLHAIADQVVDTYLEVTNQVDEDVERAETDVFAQRSHLSMDQLYMLKREVLEFRRAVQPLAQPLRRLAEGYTPLIPAEVRSYFRNVEDHLTSVAEKVNGFNELLDALLDAAAAKINLRANTDMRKITAWAAIISVPTMVAGIYGMNFDYMPETKMKYAYPVVVSIIVLACVTLYRIFRRNKWL